MAELTSDPTNGITIEWGDPTKVPLQFADFMHWRSAGDRFFITIGQTVFPLTQGPIANNAVLPVEPIIRLAITQQTLRVWVDVLQKAVATLPSTETKTP